SALLRTTPFYVSRFNGKNKLPCTLADFFPVDFINIFQHNACSFGNTAHWLFGNKYRHFQFLSEQLVHAVNERTAAGKNDAPVNNVRRQFRWSSLQYAFSCLDNH